MTVKRKANVFVIRKIGEGKWGVLNRYSGWYVAVRSTRREAAWYAKHISK